MKLFFVLGAKRAFHFSLLAYARSLTEPVLVSGVYCLAMVSPTLILPSSLFRLVVRSLCWLASGVLVCAAMSTKIRGLTVDTTPRRSASSATA